MLSLDDECGSSVISRKFVPKLKEGSPEGNQAPSQAVFSEIGKRDLLCVKTIGRLNKSVMSQGYVSFSFEIQSILEKERKRLIPVLCVIKILYVVMAVLVIDLTQPKKMS